MSQSLSDLYEEFHKLNKALRDFSPFSEKDKPLSDALSQKLLSMGDAALDYAFPSISATDYMGFLRSGDRQNFERTYFEKRHRLNDLVAAETVLRNGKYLDGIINGIFSLCEESGWQLPAHNSYERNAKQELLPDASRPVIDLFAAETGSQLAMIYYLLKDELDQVSKTISKRILDELFSRIVTPYTKSHFWWMGNGEEPMCNWTPWCVRNVLLTVFLLPTSDDERKIALQKSCYALDCFTNGYKEDGCCDEGPHYYRHAALCLGECLYILNDVTDNAFASLYRTRKIRNMCAYLSNVHAYGRYYFNYSDSQAKLEYSGIREYMMGLITTNPELIDLALSDFKEMYEDSGFEHLLKDESNELNLFCRMLTIRNADDVLNKAMNRPAPEAINKDIYYESVGLWISKNEHFQLSVKAGHNNDSHNHNDTGSIIVYKDNDPIFIDAGVEAYSAKTFSANRYDIWTMRSEYHNLPTPSGCLQGAGENFAASDVKITTYKKEPSISMELSTAYEGEHKSYKRTVSFAKETNTITLTDSTEEEDVVLHFLTMHKPEAIANGFKIGSATVSMEGASVLSGDEIPIEDEWLKRSWQGCIYRLNLKLTGNTFTMKIS